MEVILTAKIKLLPTEEQKQLLLQTMYKVRHALNYVSSIAFTNGHLSNVKQIQMLVYNYIRDTFDLKSQIACNVYNTNGPLIIQEDLKDISLRTKVKKKDRYYRMSWVFSKLSQFIEYKVG